MPEHLGKSVKIFDTLEDSTLSLKRSSTEICTKLTMALAMSHGEKLTVTRSAPHWPRTMVVKDYENQSFSGGGQKILVQDNGLHFARWCSFS
jgi:hypothetical protein